ncbi:MAG TPA: hypothetical protein VFE47_24020 [Tepidisphaeraceae bacterium]|jgi:hypothetical protein|nr:hypothetical protein [Tepidisphaeraceae bacterium]
MKYVLAFTALLALVGFVGFGHAADAKTHKHTGTFVKIDSGVMTYKGLRAPNKEHTIKVDDAKTKVTVEGKDAKLADIKADMYLTITDEDGTAVAIAATATAPTKKPK